MRPSIYWIEARDRSRLAIMPRPRAGDWLEDEIVGWRTEGVDIVISLLEPHEIAELGLQDEAALCRAQGIEFTAFPIPDRGVPASVSATDALVRRLAMDLDKGKAVAVHCRMGIGRSAVIAACVLLVRGHEVEEAFRLIGEARRVDVPDTEAQCDWVSTFATTIDKVR